MLDSYTGTNRFTFTLQTNGMRLYNNEGHYYLATSADAEEKIFLGDIVVYDAKGEPSPGTLTVTTVTMGQQYTLTVSADPAFLTDPDTVYPVTIDPTLTVSAANNSSFIEDATIYQNKPTTNAGTWTYNHCGYYASANTDYGVCRTAIRLAGLKNNSTWQSMSYSNIVSAKFYIKEATGTAGVRFTLHNMTNTTWTEANATWNSLANAYSTTVSGEASPAYGGVAEFDFTALAKSWKSNNSTDCSFMLISSNTTVDKAFYSAEFGTTSYRPYVVITYNANTNGLNYTTKSVNEGSTFQLSWPGVSSGITWTSSNTTIATVSASGLVTAKKAGTATITATANGYIPATCTVTVKLQDGIYYVNASQGISLGTGGIDISNQQLMTYTHITSGSSRYYQLWEIKYISDGKYSIRSFGNENLILYRNSNKAVTYQSAPSASIPTYGRWKIEYTANGYKILNNGSSSYALTVNGSDTSPGQYVAASSYSSTSAQAHWNLESVDEYIYTVNHYYDEGYSIRFAEINSNTESLIRSYHNAVYKRLLDIFDIYIVSEYDSFISSCDTCKSQQYGSIQFVSLDDACIHTTSHLSTTALRDDLDDGTSTQSVVIWTGHILADNAASNSSSNRNSVVITPKHTTDSENNYINKSNYEVECENIYTLIHELSHQLGAPDHYCYDKDSLVPCSNLNCDRCRYGYEKPRSCIMSYRYDISTRTNENMYCDSCLTIINAHLESHH